MVYAICFAIFILYLLAVGNSSGAAVGGAGLSAAAARRGMGDGDGLPNSNVCPMVLMGERDICSDLTFDLH